MDSDRWQQIEQLYSAALACEPSQRSRLLDQADPSLRRELEQMLSQSGSLLEQPAWQRLPEDPAASAFAPGMASGLDGIEARQSAALSAGESLGPYRIAGLLGEGGMGKVYRALDTRLGRAVAVKISTEPFSGRFEQEARSLSALNHPNICTLYDVGRLPSGEAFLVTELVEGETLREWIKRAPGLKRSLEIIRQVIEALRVAHEAGIIHRDLKPANIMVRFDGYAKVLDFGLARRIRAAGVPDAQTLSLSAPGQIAGTVAYMSPEQILGHGADARSDVFAAGIILYEIAGGQHPWPRTSAVDTMYAILHDDPLPLAGQGAAIAPVIERCLSKQPEDRFQTMADLAAALQESAAQAPSMLEVSQPSIAILPFANMSADRENEFFGDGLAEEIINALAQAPGLQVAGRTSSFFFRGKDLEFSEIGRRLNVTHILEGSIRRAGNRLRVTAQLLKAADGFHLWSQRYDREMTDIFAIQDEMTEAIAQALRVRLSPQASTPHRHVPDLRAYEAYLEGREHLLVRPSGSSYARGKELLEQAIRLDPEFALPHSILGAYYTGQAGRGSIAPREAIALARAAEQTALRVDPLLPEAHGMLGVLSGMDYDWTAAEAHWRSAMAGEPVPRDVLFWYGNHYLLPIGRAEQAVEIESKVLEHDPLNLLYRSLHAIALQHTGRLKDAETELQKVLDLDPNSAAIGTLGLIYAQQGRFDEALAVTEKAHALMPGSDLLTGQLAALLTRTGAGRANALIHQLESARSHSMPVGEAVFHALCGDFQRAAEWAERSIEERHPLLTVRLWPLMRNSPQWPVLAKRMRLA